MTNSFATQTVRRETFRGDSGDQIWVGTQTQPHLALARTCDAGEITRFAEQVRNNLNVEMGRPSAIDGIVPYLRNGRSLFDGHPFVETVQRIRAQMTIQGVEGEVFATGVGKISARDSMLQDDGWAEIKRGVIIVKAAHNPVQRREDGRTNFHEEIEPDVKGAPLRAIVAFRPELVAGVNQASLVIPPDAHVDVGRLHPLEELMGEGFDIGDVLQVAHLAAPYTQIEDHHLVCTQVWFDNSPHAVSVAPQPRDQFGRARTG